MELYPRETTGDSKTTKGKIKKSISSFKQGKFRKHTFNMTSKNVGKVNKASLKKFRLIEDQGEVIAEHQDRKLVEDEVTKHDKQNLTQAHSTKGHMGKHIITYLKTMQEIRC